jgi:hypothetical protein
VLNLSLLQLAAVVDKNGFELAELFDGGNAGFSGAITGVL